MVDNDMTFMARRFNNVMGLQSDGAGRDEVSSNQLEVFKEEVDELLDAYESGDMDDVAEETADVTVTLFVLADMLNIDLEKAYHDKMLYNLQKQGEKNGDGKVLDDAEAEKPEFGNHVNGKQGV